MRPVSPSTASRWTGDGPANLHRQLYRQLRSLIERRVLPSGYALPSTRVMARDLRIGRNTVIAACDQLALEGYLAIRPRTPPVVMDLPSADRRRAGRASKRTATRSRRAARSCSPQPYHHGKPGMLAFHPGMPDPDNFPFNTWSKLLARRAKLAHHDLFGTYHVKGYPPLCEAIARYLTASRGVKCDAEQIVVTNGAQSAFDLLARILIDDGDTVWMEEPGYYGAGSAFVSAGAKLARLRVSDAGWDLEPPPAIPAADLRHAVLSSSARRHHADGAAAQSHPHGRSLERLDHRGRLRWRIPLPGPAHPGAARHQRVKPRGLCRHLRQDPVSGDAARLHGGARAHPRHASSRRSASPASSPRCSPRPRLPTS